MAHSLLAFRVPRSAFRVPRSAFRVPRSASARLAIACTIAAALAGFPLTAAAEPPCGKTTKETIAEAEKALASKEAGAARQALACLLQAAKQPEAAPVSGCIDMEKLAKENALRRDPDGTLLLVIPAFHGGAP